MLHQGHPRTPPAPRSPTEPPPRLAHHKALSKVRSSLGPSPGVCFTRVGVPQIHKSHEAPCETRPHQEVCSPRGSLTRRSACQEAHSSEDWLICEARSSTGCRHLQGPLSMRHRSPGGLLAKRLTCQEARSSRGPLFTRITPSYRLRGSTETGPGFQLNSSSSPAPQPQVLGSRACNSYNSSSTAIAKALRSSPNLQLATDTATATDPQPSTRLPMRSV